MNVAIQNVAEEREIPNEAPDSETVLPHKAIRTHSHEDILSKFPSKTPKRPDSFIQKGGKHLKWISQNECPMDLQPFHHPS